MVDDVPGNLIQAVIALQNFQFLGVERLQMFDFVIVQIFVFDDLGKIAVEKVVGQTDFGGPIAVKERNRRSVFNALSEVIFRNIIAEPLIRQFFTAQERRSGKGDEVGVRQSGPHVVGQILVLCAMGFVDHDDDIVAGGEQRITPSFVVTELLNQGENEAAVALQIFPQLATVFRTAFLFCTNHAAAGEVFDDLPIQIIASSMVLPISGVWAASAIFAQRAFSGTKKTLHNVYSSRSSSKPSPSRMSSW